MISIYSTMIFPLKTSPPFTTSSKSFNKKSLHYPLTTLSCLNVSAEKINNIESNDQSKIIRIDTEVLRVQIDQLQAEFEATQSKANNARMRLMRLSEVAENLQKRAANSILVGKDTEAREMLIQKKKLMKALEKSKNRVDVLDKLAIKINEAISVKEAQLIGNVSMFPEFIQEEIGPQIRYVDPKVDIIENSKLTDDIGEDHINLEQDFELGTEVSEENCIAPSSVDKTDNVNQIRNLKVVPSYEEFMQYIYGKLQNVESELEMVIRLSPLVLDSEEISKGTKLQHITNLVNDIHGIRERIASIIHINKKDS